MLCLIQYSKWTIEFKLVDAISRIEILPDSTYHELCLDTVVAITDYQGSVILAVRDTYATRAVRYMVCKG